MFQPVAPFALGEIKPIRRQRLIRRAAAGLIHRFLARLIIIGDLRQALVRGFFGERLDGDRARRDIIEQRLHARMEQRQPMFHAGVAAALAHRFVEHVVGAGRAERRYIAGAEQPDGVASELELRHRHQIERAPLSIGALSLRIETPDRFQRVAEKIEPHRLIHARREQIDDAAAHRVIAGLAHSCRPIEAVEVEPLGDTGHRQHVARRSRERLLGDEFARRHALQHRIDGGEQHRRVIAALYAREPRQRHHPLRHHGGMRRDAVVGQAIPGREFQNFDLRGEEAERPRQRGHARTVAADDRDRDRRRFVAGRDGTGEVGNDEAFGSIGNAAERQRPAGLQPRRRRFRQQSGRRGHVPSPALPAKVCA